MSHVTCRGFTMVEIAICLAIIGIALVAIIGVLPIGVNVQKDNREETIIDQDASVFLENIRNGARGLDDLTNYVVAISNSWTLYDINGRARSFGFNGYNYTNATAYAQSVPAMALTNGANIIGLLSLPEFTDNFGVPIPNLNNGGYSNYVVAYVRSLSGSAVEKPPQDNDIIRGDSFSYKMICQNVPVAVYVPPNWQGQSYNAGSAVFYNGSFWRATAKTGSGDIPGESPVWARDSYSQQLTANLRELRFTFLWPLLPNGSTGNGRQTFRTSVDGQIAQIIIDPNNGKNALYFFQPGSFAAAP
ncbi:MAG TPA: prepilin-type N-terminal cleavage/methylation domain-containing protein [Candidatus Acidoferrales bacterium]|nr:prepilin-type N-terminal cleavage/methylation domain-containing protein [Candidatus Acidoferrales bacterium]